MPPAPVRSLCVLALALLPGVASAAGMLRLSCFDDSEGAVVTVNGVSKGECPLDLMVAPGTLVIQARKQPDAQHERVWEKTLLMSDGAVKSEEIILSAPRLTAEARRAQERQAQEQARAEFRAELQAAQAGDEAAIGRVIARFEADRRVQEVAYWRGRLEAARAARVLAAATAGAPDAMEEMASRYEQGQGVAADAARAAEWRQQAATTRKAQQAAQQRAALLEKRKKISFVGFTKEMLTGANEAIAGKRRDVSSAPTWGSVAYSYLPVWLALDVVTAPTNMTNLVKVNKELEALALRPAAWGNPDSLMAQVARQSAVAP